MLEAEMLLHLAANGIVAPVTEHRFHPKRRWKFDMAWPDRKLALEIEGGVWHGGRHTTGAGFTADCEKYNEATVCGWRVLRVTGDQISSGAAIDWLRRAMSKQGAERPPF